MRAPTAPRLSLAQRILFWVLPLSLLGILVSSLTLYRAAKAQILKDVRKEVSDFSYAAALTLERFFEQRRSDLDAVAESPLLKDYEQNREYGLVEEAETDRRELEAYFAKVSSRTGAFESIAYVDKSGKLAAHAGSPPDPGKKDRWTIEADPPKWTMRKEIDGGGAVVMVAKLSAVESALARLKAGKGGETALIAADGRPLIGRLLPEGPETLVSDAPIARTPWSVRAAARLADFSAPLESIWWRTAWLCLALGSGVAVLILVLVRRLTAPIRDLVEATRRFGEGRLEHRVPVRADDELGGLARRFNLMASSLQSRLRELESLKGLSDAVIRHLDKEKIGRICVRAAAEGLGFDRAGLYLVDGSMIRGFCTFNTEKAGFTDAEMARREIPLDGRDILAWVVKERLPANVKDPAKDPRCNPGFVRETGTKGFCLAPVMHQDRVYGVLAVDNRESGREIDDAQVKTLTLFSNAAGLAFANQDLFEGIRRSEARYRAVVEHSQDAIVGLDAAMKTVVWSDGAKRIFGRDAKEMLGATIERLFALGEYRRIAELAVEKGTLVSVEARGLTAEARPLDLCLSWARSGGGEGPEWSLVIRDVTEQKAVLAQLIQSEKLSLTGRLLSGVAHDLNNPLQSVVGYAELLAEESREGGLGGKTRAELELIELNARRCAAIVDNLLLFVRQAPAAKEPVCIKKAMEETLLLLEHSLKKTERVEVRVDAAEDLPPVLGRLQALEQVFVNLIQNSCHAMAGMRGRKRLRLTVRKEGDRVVAIVDDNGPGIPGERREKVFEPFFTTRREGTGLGLAICRQIASEHGGTIACAQSPLGGASFRLELPAAALWAGGESPKRGPPPSPGKTVLVVDDEPGLSAMMRKVLVREGQTVIEAPGGQDALGLLRRRRFDLVVCDLHLGETSAAPILEAVRGLSPPPAFLLVTGDILWEKRPENAVFKGVPVLYKTFSPSAFRDAARGLLAGKALEA